MTRNAPPSPSDDRAEDRAQQRISGNSGQDSCPPEKSGGRPARAQRPAPTAAAACPRPGTPGGVLSLLQPILGDPSCGGGGKTPSCLGIAGDETKGPEGGGVPATRAGRPPPTSGQTWRAPMPPAAGQGTARCSRCGFPKRGGSEQRLAPDWVRGTLMRLLPPKGCGTRSRSAPSPRDR